MRRMVRPPSPGRQVDLEAAPAALAGEAARVAAVAPRDLADQSEAEARAGLRGRSGGRPIERREDLLALLLRHAGAAIAHAQAHASALAMDVGLDGRAAV